MKTLLEVLDEEFVGNGTRCALVDQRLDSSDIERWKLLLPLLGWLDEIQRTNHAGYVRAAQRMLLARRIVYSTITYGYSGEVIPGFFTKRGRAVRMVIVDEDTALVINYNIDKFNSGVSIGRIAKQLNADSSLPRPPKSDSLPGAGPVGQEVCPFTGRLKAFLKHRGSRALDYVCLSI